MRWLLRLLNRIFGKLAKKEEGMAYGVVIETTDGLKDITDVQATRVVSIVNVRSSTGSASVPDFDSNNGFYFVESISHIQFIPNFSWNNSTKVLSWVQYPIGGGTPNDNVDVWFFSI